MAKDIVRCDPRRVSHSSCTMSFNGMLFNKLLEKYMDIEKEDKKRKRGERDTATISSL